MQKARLINKVEEDNNNELRDLIYYIYESDFKNPIDFYYDFNNEDFFIFENVGGNSWIPSDTVMCICSNIKPWEFWDTFDWRWYTETPYEEEEEDNISVFDRFSNEEIREIIDNFDLHEEVIESILYNLQEKDFNEW